MSTRLRLALAGLLVFSGMQLTAQAGEPDGNSGADNVYRLLLALPGSGRPAAARPQRRRLPRWLSGYDG